MSTSVPPPRSRSRELFTLLASFAFAITVGKALLSAFKSPPFILAALVFTVLYVVCYIAVYHATARIFRS